MTKASSPFEIEVQPIEKLHVDRRMPITIGQFAVGARRTFARNTLSDIIGLDETRKLVDAEQEALDAMPKVPPRHGPAVRFH